MNINRCPVASEEDDAGLALKSARPLRDRPSRVVDRFQQIVARVAKGDKRRPLESVFIPFLNGLLTAKLPVRC